MWAWLGDTWEWCVRTEKYQHWPLSFDSLFFCCCLDIKIKVIHLWSNWWVLFGCDSLFVWRLRGPQAGFPCTRKHYGGIFKEAIGQQSSGTDWWSFLKLLIKVLAPQTLVSPLYSARNNAAAGYYGMLGHSRVNHSNIDWCCTRTKLKGSEVRGQPEGGDLEPVLQLQVQVWPGPGDPPEVGLCFSPPIKGCRDELIKRLNKT